MRPPDENQTGSTRPNLLSGARRRFSGDDNILERLERDSARQASGNRSRAAWYAAAASLLLLLIVVVGWMAYESASTLRVVPMTRLPAERDHPVDAIVRTDGPREGAVMAPLPALPHAAPAPDRTAAAATLPPLVLLPADDMAARKPVAAAPPSVAAPRAPAAPRPAPVAQQQATPTRAVPRAAAVAVARQRTPVASNPANEPAVDRDVALLSAIIIHDSTHAEEKAQLESAAACARAISRKCRDDAPTEPSLKRWSR